MPHGQDKLAVKVISLLKCAKPARDDEALLEAVDVAKVAAPEKLSDLTPRFEAYFAIATLVTALRHREDRDSIGRRFAHAVSLTKTWAEPRPLNTHPHHFRS